MHNHNDIFVQGKSGGRAKGGVSLAIMDDRSSLRKVSGSTESVSTVTSEEFVLVQNGAEGSPSSSEGRPRLKVINMISLFLLPLCVFLSVKITANCSGFST